MRNDNAVVSIESINSRMVGNPSFTGLWKGCPSYGHDLDSDKESDLPSADILSSVQSSRRFADHFHRETTNTVIVPPHWEKLDNLKFKLL